MHETDSQAIPGQPGRLPERVGAHAASGYQQREPVGQWAGAGAADRATYIMYMVEHPGGPGYTQKVYAFGERWPGVDALGERSKG